jgi:hypothetical protein
MLFAHALHDALGQTGLVLVFHAIEKLVLFAGAIFHADEINLLHRSLRLLAGCEP